MRLQVTGLKARPLDLPLAPLTLLAAPNGHGKSACLAALQLLALGYLPALGKRLTDVGPLLGERKATITLTLDGRRVVTRIIERTDKGLTSRVHCSWLDEAAKPADHAREALALFGADEQEVAEALDVRELLQATPNQRAARIERLLTSAAPTDLLDRLARKTLQLLVKIEDERMPANWRALDAMLTEPHAEAVARLWPLVEAKLAATDLPATFAYVNERKRDVALGRTRKQQAETELRQRLQDIPAADAERIPVLEAERGQLDQRIGALEEQQREATTRGAARTEAEAEITQAEAERDRAAQARMAWVEARESAPGPEAALRTVEAELDALTAPTAPDDTRARELEAEIAGAQRLHDAIQLPEVPTLDAERRAVADAQAALATLTGSPWWLIAVNADRIIQLASGTAKKDQAIKAVAVEMLDAARAQTDPAQKPALEDALRKAERALGAAEERARRAAEHRATAEAERREYAAHIEGLRAQVATLRELPADYRDALATYETTRARLITERDELRQAVATRERHERETSDALTAADATLHAAQSKLDGIGAARPTAELDRALAAARERRGAVVTEIDTLTTNATRRRELDAIVAELKALDAEREVLVALESALQQARGEAVQAAGGPLLEGLTTFLRGAGRTEVPYIRVGKGVCDLGWIDAAKREVDIVALGEAEWQLFTAGLVAVMNQLRRPPFPVALVEAAGCTQATLEQMLAGIGAVSDGLALAIVCTPHVDGPSREAGGWSLIALGEARRSEAA